MFKTTLFVLSRASLVVQMVKSTCKAREQVQSLGWKDPLEKRKATHSRILAWRITQSKEPGGLQSMGSQTVGHDWATNFRRENNSGIH